LLSTEIPSAGGSVFLEKSLALSHELRDILHSQSSHRLDYVFVAVVVLLIRTGKIESMGRGL